MIYGTNSYNHQKMRPTWGAFFMQKIDNCRQKSTSERETNERNIYDANLYFPYQAADASPLTAERLLRALGVTRKHKGFRYAEYMIEAVADDADRLRLITKCLYPETARHFDVTQYAVERSLRTLVKACWRKKDHTQLNLIVGTELREPPTNTEFVDYLAAYLAQHR